MKYTNPPWEFKEDKIVQANSSDTESNVIAYGVLPHNRPILAAAPDMYEALKRFNIDHIHPVIELETCKYCQVQKIIAKIEGKL